MPSSLPPCGFHRFIAPVTTKPHKLFRLSAVDKALAMATNGKEEETKPIVFYQEEENLQKLCNFLRSKEGPPVREAIEMDKRVHYLKGEY